MEEQLRQSEERFKRIALNLPIATSYCDRDGNFLFANKKYVDLFGYTIEDLPTIDMWEEAVFPDEAYRKNNREM